MTRACLLVVMAACCGAYAQNLAVVGVKVYPSPGSRPMERATILIRDGKIAEVGSGVRVPEGVAAITCNGCVALAGFWNAHVHFTESKWDDSAILPAGRLTKQLQDMLTHSGFTSVVDTGSDPRVVPVLRRRVESGEVRGPRIYTAGTPLYPPRGVPYYLNDLPPEVRAILPQPPTPAEAVASVQRNIAAGSDIVKLFTGSYVARGEVKPMPVEIAKAAVAAAHQHGQLVFAHPSNAEGMRVAMESGVDVLAHAPDSVAEVDNGLVDDVVDHHMAMVPTLKLFSGDQDIARIRSIVARFHGRGGVLLFGTDTGFVTDYDLTEEYRQLRLAGLKFSDVLAMLTTAPAGRFGMSKGAGRLETGFAGDVTILEADPSRGDLTAFTRVRYTVRGGRVIYGAE